MSNALQTPDRRFPMAAVYGTSLLGLLTLASGVVAAVIGTRPV